MLHILTFLNKFLTGNQDITSDKKDNLPYLIICSIDRTKRGQLACLSPDLIDPMYFKREKSGTEAL